MSTSRGIRNNNPGNIRHGDNWLGLAPEQTDSDFCQFTTPEFGIRAMARTLFNYQHKHGINTVRGIVNRWAPPSENKTDSYVAHVAAVVGVGPDEKINVRAYLPVLVEVIIKHENGKQPYTAEQIYKGVDMALAGK